MKITKDSSFIMVTGVARSGTTLLAEALNHHPQLMCAPDPMNELFRAFMHFCHYQVTGEKKNSYEPMDNYFLKSNSAVFKFLNQTDMCHQIPGFMREKMLERISRRGGYFCPEIKDSVLNCKSETFDKLIIEIMELLNEAYGKESTQCFGFKDAWCEQMILPLSRTFPNMKFINIIRDPRAVVSSNFVSNSVYPLLFNVRDWRKSVYYSWRYQENEKGLASRFLLLKYEELIENPKQTLESLTEYLGIDYSETMVEGVFKPSNTNYEKENQETVISERFKDKWITHLPEDKCIQVELFCEPEMEKLGYPILHASSLRANILHVLFGADIKFSKLGAWCQRLVSGKLFYNTFWQWQQRSLEYIRLFLYRSRKSSSQLICSFFYERAYFEWLLKEPYSTASVVKEPFLAVQESRRSN